MVLGIELKNANRNNKHELDLLLMGLVRYHPIVGKLLTSDKIILMGHKEFDKELRPRRKFSEMAWCSRKVVSTASHLYQLGFMQTHRNNICCLERWP